MIFYASLMFVCVASATNNTTAVEQPPTVTMAPVKSIELDKYYADEIKLRRNETINSMLWYWFERLASHRNLGPHWRYYSLDLTHLGDESLKVDDEKHALAQLKSDIKVAVVSQWQDLVIELIDTGDGFSDPNLYISLNGTQPNLTSYDLHCSFFGEDICVISGADIAAHSTKNVTIGVFCARSCQFKVQAELSAEINLEAGKMHNIYFKENQQRIFRFHVPNDSSIDEVQIRGINKNKFAQFEMLVNKGSHVPDTSNALILWPAWENGYIGKFYRNCFCFCTGCNYTVLVSAKHAGYINVGAMTKGKYTDLKSFPGGEIYDSLLGGTSECFTYAVTDAGKDVRVSLQAFSGDPNVYVSPKQPIDHTNFTSAKYNSLDHFWNEELVLEPETRARDNAETGMFYLCVYGTGSTSYKLSAKNEDHSVWLRAGVSESGYIEHDQVKQFYFTDKELMDPEIRVKLDGHVMTGGVRVRSKLCRRVEPLNETCSYTQEELKEEQADEKIVIHEGSETERPDPKLCSPDATFGRIRNATQAGCVYVIGVIGLANQTSHYSIMLELSDLSGKQHPLRLSEGMPITKLIKPRDSNYFIFTVDDDQIDQVSIQLTTIHGDPDIYVTYDDSEPSTSHFDRRSVNYGLYPDIIVFRPHNRMPSLKHTYRVMITAVTESTYSLEYFTSTQNGTEGIQKLLVGKAQRGVLTPNMSLGSSKQDFIQQPSHMYHFKVSSDVLKQPDASIEVRLNAEHGDFMYLVKAQQQPTVDDFYDRKADVFFGGELKNVVITKHDLDVKLKKEIEQGHSLINFYVRVMPYYVSRKYAPLITVENATEPFVYSIAFYDQKQLKHLRDGKPVRGVVSRQSIDYYYFDLRNLDADYEISLGPISGGNPDLVLSLDHNNKYPTKEHSDMYSNNLYDTDSITLTKQMIKEAVKKGNQVDGKLLQAYIGVYTKDADVTVYSLVMSRRINFNPIELKMGKIISGSVRQGQKKFYYAQAQAYRGANPIRLDLLPTRGNPDLEVTVINDMSASRQQWLEMTKTPLYKSNSTRGLDTMVLDADSNKVFKEKCGSSCIIIVAVVGGQDPKSKAFDSRYKIQISQDFTELTEGNIIKSSIKTSNAAILNGTADMDHYKFFKFYKSCDLDCDLAIDVYPNGNFARTVNILINYENPDDPMAAHEGLNLLPTWQSDPAWTIAIKKASRITVKSTEEWFQKHKARVGGKELPITSRGYYIIGVHSYSDVSFSIAARTLVSDDFVSTGSKERPLDIEKLFVGDHPHDVILAPGEERYFYFQNWRDERLCFVLDFLTKHYQIGDAVDMEIGRLNDSENPNDGQGGRVPRSMSELERRWVATFSSLFQQGEDNGNLHPQECIEEGSQDFCVFCTYLIRLSNKRPVDQKASKDVKVRLFVQQQMQSMLEEIDKDSERAGQNVTHWMPGRLHIGQPQPVRLGKDEAASLNLVVSPNEHGFVVEIEVILGDAQVTLTRDRDGYTLYEHPCPMNESHHIEGNVIAFNVTEEQLATAFLNKTKEDSDEMIADSTTGAFTLRILSTSTVFQSQVYVHSKNTLPLLPDGRSVDLSFVYSKTDKQRWHNFKYQTHYFLYAPTSHKFELELNAELVKVASDVGTFFMSGNSDDRGDVVRDGVSDKSEGAVEGWRGLDRRFFHFKVNLKKIEMNDDVKSTDVSWPEEFLHDEQFDFTMRSQEKSSGSSHLFRIVDFEADPSTDLILVRLAGWFNEAYANGADSAEIEYRYRMSASDVDHLEVGSKVRGVVSDEPDKYRVYELNVNNMLFPKQLDALGHLRPVRSVDLFLMFTPCAGLMKFYLSDNYNHLFKKFSELPGHHLQTKQSFFEGQDAETQDALHIFHKRSNVRAFRSGKDDVLMDQYTDDFGVQGKRIKNVEKITGKRIWIGIKTLNEAERTKELAEREKYDREHLKLSDEIIHKRKSMRAKRFHPLKGKFLPSLQNVSSFEIQAEFIQSSKPDFLDMYRIKDEEFGIQVTNSGGHGKERRISFHWSPLTQLDQEFSGIRYIEIEDSVEYKLFLGYEDEMFDKFSSICSLEAFDMLMYDDLLKVQPQNSDDEPDGPGRRRLFSNCRFLQISETVDSDFSKGPVKSGQPVVRHYSTYGQAHLTLHGNDILHKLKNAVVMAAVHDENGRRVHLAYAPVTFNDVYDFDAEANRIARLKFWGPVIIISCLAIAVIVYICFARAVIKNTSGNQREGISMQEIATSERSTSVVNTSAAAETTQQSSEVSGSMYSIGDAEDDDDTK